MEQSKALLLTIKVVLVVICMILAGVSPVFGQTSHARIGVLTPGITYGPIQEGLREGLARLGYKEGKNIDSSGFLMGDNLG